MPENTAIFSLLILLDDFDEVLCDVFDSFVGKLKLILVFCHDHDTSFNVVQQLLVTFA